MSCFPGAWYAQAAHGFQSRWLESFIDGHAGSETDAEFKAKAQDWTCRLPSSADDAEGR